MKILGRDGQGIITLYTEIDPSTNNTIDRLVLKQIHTDLPGQLDKAQNEFQMHDSINELHCDYILYARGCRTVEKPVAVVTGANLVVCMILYLEYRSWGILTI